MKSTKKTIFFIVSKNQNQAFNIFMFISKFSWIMPSSERESNSMFVSQS